MKEREQFQKWRQDNDHQLDTYNDPDDCMWQAWQAARTSQQVPEGMVLVPDAANMTDDQAEAIAKVANCCGWIAYEIYCAAIAAAPSAQSTGGEG